MTKRTTFKIIEDNGLIDIINIGCGGSEWRYVGRKEDDSIVIIAKGGYVSYSFDSKQTEKILEMMHKTEKSSIYKRYEKKRDRLLVSKRLTE